MTSTPANPSAEIGVDNLPVWTGQIELSSPLSRCEPLREEGPGYRTLRLLVRLHHQPIGYVTIRESSVEAVDLVTAIWDHLGASINRHLVADGLPEISSLSVGGVGETLNAPCEDLGDPADLPLVSVVLCTRERPSGAASVVREFVALKYPKFEVVVVDNAPRTDATRSAIASEFSGDERVRYVVEHLPGLSRARNRGVQEARGTIVAFTDDDVRVDEWWLNGVIRGFSRAGNVGCVTGLVPSAELENPLQLYFDRRVSWGWSCEPRIFDLGHNRDHAALYPYQGGLYGTGANFAFRKSVLASWGGFDEALGAGSPAGGGEDLDVFVRTLLNGASLVYEPSAIVSHQHRTELDTLNRQMFTYGSGLTAFVVKYLFDRNTLGDVLRRVPRGVQQLFHINSRSENLPVPRSTRFRETLGMIYGPVGLVRGRVLEHRPAGRNLQEAQPGDS